MAAAKAHVAEHMIRIVVADDHPAIVDAVTRFVVTQEDIEIVGTAGDGSQALRVIKSVTPDVVLADINMPHVSGIELVRRLDTRGGPPGVILYTGSADTALLVEALDAGARAFVLKESPLADLGRAIRSVASGGTYVDPVLGGVFAAPEATERLAALSKREREILRLLADGMRDQDVGAALFISPLTVRTHVKHAMEKLEADTRTQAVATALRQAIIA